MASTVDFFETISGLGSLELSSERVWSEGRAATDGATLRVPRSGR